MATLAKMGGKISTLTLYGQAETVTGEIAAKLKVHARLFLATKVGTTGKAEGLQQLERSLGLLGKKPLDLIQVHNLIDWETQLATLQAWKKQGRIRYTGITHSTTASRVTSRASWKRSGSTSCRSIILSWTRSRRARSACGERARRRRDRQSPVRTRRFVRARAREAATRMGGRVRLQSRAQFFLKWIVAHPAVTCAIPATSKPHHMEDNLQAGLGRLPDEKMRRRMVEAMSAF